MAKQIINIGATANDKSGDPLRTAFNKVNQNFTELYTLLGVTSLTELAQDYAAEMFTGGTHSGVNVVYSDSTNKLNLTVVIDGGDASSTF
jgi:inhibitor of KinA sporulation pathway (predicted exonuclease)